MSVDIVPIGQVFVLTTWTGDAPRTKINRPPDQQTSQPQSPGTTNHSDLSSGPGG